jgi:deoxyribose-phosphate aldolase
MAMASSYSFPPENELKDLLSRASEAEKRFQPSSPVNILSLIDLTSLEGKDNRALVEALCKKAIAYGVAAVCLYPELIAPAREILGDAPIRLASVAGGFPSGQIPLNLRLKEAEYALTAGAGEIDMVISRGKFLEGDFNAVYDEVFAMKSLCGTVTLKVILETGELESDENIIKASFLALAGGADFLKTSTGKISVGATPRAVALMAACAQYHENNSGKKTGIKPSGGISDEKTALHYLGIVEAICGAAHLNPEYFRFGASRLADVMAGKETGSGGY